MKKLVLLLVFVIVSFFSLNAQHDIKLNLFGIAYRNYSASYEYVISNKSGFNLVGSFYSTPEGITSIFGIHYIGIGFTTEYRYYFMERDKPATGFFIAPYLKYNWKKATGIPFDTDEAITVNLMKTDLVVNKYAIGGAIGGKLIIDEFLIGWYVGGGAFLHVKRTFSNDELTDKQKDVIGKPLYKYQLRLGFNVGYRFGE